MRERLISIDNYYEKEYDYIVKSLQKAKIISAQSTSGARRNVHVATVNDKEEKIICGAIEEVLFTGFKWRYYVENVLSKSDCVEDKALRFCLLDIDSQIERRFFREKVFSSGDVHIDAVYNFGMGVVKNVWNSYVDLMNDFYSTSPDRIDKTELIAYVLSLNLRKSESKTVKYYVEEEKVSRFLQNVFYYKEKPRNTLFVDKDTQRLVSEIFGNY